MGREDETFARDRMAHLRRTMADRARLDAGIRDWAFRTGYKPRVLDFSSTPKPKDELEPYQHDEPEHSFYVDGRPGMGTSQKINGSHFTRKQGLSYTTYEVNGHRVSQEDYEKYKQMSDSAPRLPGEDPDHVFKKINKDIISKKNAGK